MNRERPVIVYTDGACKGNPGPGGFGALLMFGRNELEIVGWEPATTNNRMELLAPAVALEALKRPCVVDVYSDSRYVIDGITKWYPGWVARGWKKVKNVDLWGRLKAATRRHEVRWHWVEGHAGVADNERVDQLASRAAILQAPPPGDWELDPGGCSARRRSVVSAP